MANRKRALITSIAYHLPEAVLDNASLEAKFPDLPAEKILAKTGIAERRVAGSGETASDLAVLAAEDLFQGRPSARDEIDALILCTQTPDYLLPTTACLVQDRLGLGQGVAAFDINLGCSGFIYGLGVAKGLIETGQARSLLLLTADTYSKLIDPEDRSVLTLFGDGAAATLIEGRVGQDEMIGPFVYGTDGGGAGHLIARTGGIRGVEDGGDGDEGGHSPWLHMSGPDIFSFTIVHVPECIQQLEEKAEISRDEVDLFVFHQANGFMLEHLRKKLGLQEDRFFVYLEPCGNTVSSTIPIALAEAERAGRLEAGMLVMLVGFGVGLSWGATLVRWGVRGE